MSNQFSLPKKNLWLLGLSKLYRLFPDRNSVFHSQNIRHCPNLFVPVLPLNTRSDNHLLTLRYSCCEYILSFFLFLGIYLLFWNCRFREIWDQMRKVYVSPADVGVATIMAVQTGTGARVSIVSDPCEDTQLGCLPAYLFFFRLLVLKCNYSERNHFQRLTISRCPCLLPPCYYFRRSRSED